MAIETLQNSRCSWRTTRGGLYPGKQALPAALIELDGNVARETYACVKTSLLRRYTVPKCSNASSWRRVWGAWQGTGACVWNRRLQYEELTDVC